MTPIPRVDEPARDAAVGSLTRRSCDLGHGGGCYHHGLRYRQPDNMVDWAAAAPWLERSTALSEWACNAGDQDACEQWAYNLDHGRGAKRDVARAVDLYRQVCDLAPDDGTACSRLGEILASDALGEPDAAAANRAFARGCACTVSKGCVALGRVYLKGAGVEQSDAEAIWWFRKGCPEADAARHLRSCTDLDRMCEEGKVDAC